MKNPKTYLFSITGQLMNIDSGSRELRGYYFHIKDSALQFFLVWEKRKPHGSFASSHTFFPVRFRRKLKQLNRSRDDITPVIGVIHNVDGSNNNRHYQGTRVFSIGLDRKDHRVIILSYLL